MTTSALARNSNDSSSGAQDDEEPEEEDGDEAARMLSRSEKTRGENRFLPRARITGLIWLYR